MEAGMLKVLAVCIVAVAWMFVSSALIILNKVIMVDLGFAYPMFVAGIGMFATGVFANLTCRVFQLVEVKAKVDFNFWWRRVIPIGFFMGFSLATGNLVYMYLTVALIQMMKSMVPVMTMICLFIARLEDPKPNLILSVLVTAAGTALAAYGEVNLSIPGIIIMLSSETAESIRIVLTQHLLVGLHWHPVEGLMYLAPACASWLLVGSAVAEMPRMWESGHVGIILTHPWHFAAASVLGFAVNGLSYAVIKLASALTLKVLGTVKNTMLVLFGVAFLGEVVTPGQSIGYLVSLVGFGWYNQIKMSQIVDSATTAGYTPLVTVIKSGP